MRGAIFVLALVALAGMAGTATAHYLVEQPTPVGTVCAVNFEHLIEGAQQQDPELFVSGVAALDCE